MIKIINLNFQTQTIESIQVDGDNIHDVALKLTKTTFKIVIKKKDAIIKKEIKKKKNEQMVDMVIDEDITEEPVVEPAVEEIPVMEEIPVTEVKEEIPVMEVIETNKINEVLEPVVTEEIPVMEVIDLAKMKELIEKQIPKKNTADTYYRTIKDVYTRFKIVDMNELLTKEQEIISYIESQYSNGSTVKNKLCGFYKAYKILGIQGDLFKKRIDYYTTKNTIDQDETKQDNKKSIEEGDEVLSHFENQMEKLREVIQKDTQENDNSMLDNWSVEVQLYCVLKIYLSIGVLRPSELIKCLITDADCDNNTNYINVTSKQIVINNHKNDRNGVKVIDINDKKLLGILRKGIGKFLITNNNGELYQSSSAFSKVFYKNFGENVYDLRKAVSSKCIAEGNVEQVKKLEHNQGHSLSTILEFYNVYSKST